MSENHPTSVRTYHTTMTSFIVTIVLIPIIVLVTWPLTASLGDARSILISFFALPLFCFIALGHTVYGHSFEFRAAEHDVLIQPRMLLVRAGAPFRVPFQTITSLDWYDDGEGCDLSITVAGEAKYFVTTSRSKARGITQMVVEVQPNLKPNLHADLT